MTMKKTYVNDEFENPKVGLFDFWLETKSVNSQSVLEIMKHFFREGFELSGVRWTNPEHVEFFISIGVMFLEDNIDAGVLDAGQIICDARNNTQEDIDNGLYHFDFHFRQKHCLNITKMLYTIKLKKHRRPKYSLENDND